MKAVARLLVAAVLAWTCGVRGQTAPTPGSMSEGEVRRIDKEQGKLTLRHGPLQNLEMPAMTMVFKAADAKMLDGLKEGDRVRFTAERLNGVITVTAIEPAPR
jgi:Cu/Ag efflux protein CusF